MADVMWPTVDRSEYWKNRHLKFGRRMSPLHEQQKRRPACAADLAALHIH